MRSIGLKPRVIPFVVAAMTIPIVLVAVLLGEVIVPLAAWVVLATIVVLAGGRYGEDENVERRRRHGSDP
jgi:hypothetical protein